MSPAILRATANSNPSAGNLRRKGLTGRGEFRLTYPLPQQRLARAGATTTFAPAPFRMVGRKRTGIPTNPGADTAGLKLSRYRS